MGSSSGNADRSVTCRRTMAVPPLATPRTAAGRWGARRHGSPSCGLDLCEGSNNKGELVSNIIEALKRRDCGARGSTPLHPHHRGQSPGPLCERGDQPMVVWEAGARRRSTPCAGTKPICVLLPVLPMGPPRARGDQTNVRYILIRADGPGRQSCALRRSVQLRPKARGDRSATQDAQAQRKAVPRVRRTERTQARNVFAVCRDSNGWLARPAPRGACWLERIAVGPRSGSDLYCIGHR